MKVQVSFSAETPADIKKLIVTLAAFSSGVSIEAETPEQDSPANGAKSEETDKVKKTREKKTKAEKVEEVKGDEFNFDDDITDELVPEAVNKIDLAAIRTLVNEKAPTHAASIRSVMGSFNVTKLGDLKAAQFDMFYKAINNLK